jgi:hypothetical protein
MLVVAYSIVTGPRMRIVPIKITQLCYGVLLVDDCGLCIARIPEPGGESMAAIRIIERLKSHPREQLLLSRANLWPMANDGLLET